LTQINTDSFENGLAPDGRLLFLSQFLSICVHLWLQLRLYVDSMNAATLWVKEQGSESGR
jgi:hypothetical protein